MSIDTRERPRERHEDSLADLFRRLASDIPGLFRKEVELAKAEASEKFDQTLSGAGAILVGAVLALGALGVLLSAIVALGAAFLVALGMGETMAGAISAIVVAVIVGLIAWAFIAKGRSALKTTNLSMNRTAASLGRDADIVKERL